MLTNLFCVYDSAASRYLDPFNAPTVEFAIREFRSTVNRKDSHFHRFPEDYTLFHIGEFDPEKGELVGFPPRSLGVALTFLDASVTLDPENLNE